MLKYFEIKRVGDLWVPADPRVEDLARFQHDEVSSFGQIRAYLFVPVEAAFPGEYALDWPVPQLRADAFVRVDAASDALILNGFSFEGTTFSLTIEAQIRYATMMMLADALPYPLGINSLDDNVCLQLQNGDHTRLFCMTALGYVKGVIDSGTVQKDVVRAMETAAELAAYQDPRAQASPG